MKTPAQASRNNNRRKHHVWRDGPQRSTHLDLRRAVRLSESSWATMASFSGGSMDSTANTQPVASWSHDTQTGDTQGGPVAVGYRSCCRSSGCSRSGTAAGPGRCTPWPPSPASPWASSAHICPGSRHLWTGSQEVILRHGSQLWESDTIPVFNSPSYGLFKNPCPIFVTQTLIIIDNNNDRNIIYKSTIIACISW